MTEYRQDILFFIFFKKDAILFIKKDANVLTCKRFEFVLQVEGLLANSPQIDSEFRTDGILLYDSAHLEDFACDRLWCWTCIKDLQ